jgi:hypothetical protein
VSRRSSEPPDIESAGYDRGLTHPAARASSSLQNQRSPLASSIFVFAYAALPGT